MNCAQMNAMESALVHEMNRIERAKKGISSPIEEKTKEEKMPNPSEKYLLRWVQVQ